MIQEPPPRLGIGWGAVVLSLGCSVLIASDVLTGRASNLPQSAESYYTAFKEVQSFHQAAMAVDILVLVSTLLSIVFVVLTRWAKSALVLLSFVGVALCWAELVWVVQLRSEPVFSLHGLPFRPVGNSGIFGAEVFAGYLFMQIPSGRLTGWRPVLLKVGLAVCFFVLQLMVWDGIWRGAGSRA